MTTEIAQKTMDTEKRRKEQKEIGQLKGLFTVLGFSGGEVTSIPDTNFVIMEKLY